MTTTEEKLRELETRVSSIEKQLGMNQPKQYDHLTSSELMERLEHLIEKANSIEGLSSRSATEILLEDRR